MRHTARRLPTVLFLLAGACGANEATTTVDDEDDPAPYEEMPPEGEPPPAPAADAGAPDARSAADGGGASRDVVSRAPDALPAAALPGKWAWRALPRTPVATAECAVAQVDSKFYVIGGYTNRIAVYDARTNTWG